MMHLTRQFHVRQAAIGLQFAQDAQVHRVQFHRLPLSRFAAFCAGDRPARQQFQPQMYVDCCLQCGSKEFPMSNHQIQTRLAADTDPQETAEWQDALQAVLQAAGPARARADDCMSRQARGPCHRLAAGARYLYVNTIAVEQQPFFLGDLGVEERLASWMRWNALAMVVYTRAPWRAGRPHRQL